MSLLLLSLLPSVAAGTPVLEPMVVSVTRAPESVSSLAAVVDILTPEQLTGSPALAVDDLLKSSAAFSLFRRTGSLSANPTTQGASLRNLGPNGAGRTLVLMDGVPLNDPFGGWVAWTKILRLNVGTIEIVRGGGSGAWGSAAMGGTIHVRTAPGGPGRTQVLTEVGERELMGVEFSHRVSAPRDELVLVARHISSAGDLRPAPAWSGPIDRPTDLAATVVQAAWTHTLAGGKSGTVTARIFDEERGNGTPLQRNHTREAILAGTLQGNSELRGRDVAWTASAYVQDQTFSNLFTAVSAARDSEIPVLDQYEVPATAVGASATAAWRDGGSATTLGTDARWVTGETRERYLLVDGVYARERRAGGSQGTVGAFIQHQRALAPEWQGSAALRVDAWEINDARRRESARATGAILRDERPAARRGTQLSPRAGLIWRPRSGWRWHASVYSAFRLPTLNELHRPFRIGDDVTEANPDLVPERLIGAESGVTFRGESTGLRLNVFDNRLRDAVANVTLGTGPGQIPGVGFVPAGGIGRRRENIGSATVRGIELTGDWRVAANLKLRADYLLSDATDSATGLRLPQTSRHTLVVDAAWRPVPTWSLTLRARHLSTAFEDDANTLPLAAVTTWETKVARRLGDRGEVFLAVENLFDAEIVSRRTSTGYYEVGAPRRARLGLLWAW